MAGGRDKAAMKMTVTRSPRLPGSSIHRLSFAAAVEATLFAATDVFALETEAAAAAPIPWLPLALGVIIVLQGAMIWVLLVQHQRQRSAAAEIRQQRAEIAHAARLTLVGELTASIAHEVSQPLGAILSNAEAAAMLLQRTPINLEEVHRILQDIRRDDLRAHEIVSHLRALLQKRELLLEAVNINDVASEVQRFVAHDAMRRKIRISIALDPQLPSVSADQIHLKQVLLNLIINAMDAIDKSDNGEREVAVSTNRVDARTVRVLVTDSGPGFSPGVLAKLFDPFVTTKPHGMGLGLSIARTIVQAHGGSIWAENGANGGGIVGFAIPTRGG